MQLTFGKIFKCSTTGSNLRGKTSPSCHLIRLCLFLHCACSIVSFLSQALIAAVYLQRIVRFGGAVDDDNSNLLVAQLLYLDSIGKKDITMYVNSPGGSVTAGWFCQSFPHVRSFSYNLMMIGLIYIVTVIPNFALYVCLHIRPTSILFVAGSNISAQPIALLRLGSVNSVFFAPSLPPLPFCP